MSAFGPFSTHEEIDFSSLGDNPLFLINGPTGSGKTTILDAICFALYGETTGDDRQGKEMRCDRAASDLLTEVVLTFELAGQRYRIRRVPDQERPKARGEGMTSQSAEAQLWSLDDEGVESLLVPRKVNEANARIVQLTGLSADQFRQVMVLPQGKFRDLLLADSQDREGIFRQLFQTHVYTRLEEKLRHQANALSAEVKQLQQKQGGLLEAVAVDSLDALQTETVLAEKGVTETLLRQQEQEEQHKKFYAELQDAIKLDEQFKKLLQFKGEHKALLATKADHDADQTTLKLAQLAADMEALYSQAKQRGEEEKAAALVLQQSVEHGKSCDVELQQAEQSWKKNQAREAELDVLKNQLHTLESYRVRCQQLNTSQLKLKQSEKTLQQAQKECETLEQAQNQRLKLREESQAQLSQLQIQVSAVNEKRLLLERSQQQIENRKRLADQHDLQVDAENRLAKGQALLQEREAQLQQATRQRKILETAWKNGQAALLAKSLEEGEACPVCGSDEHPKIAHYEDALPDDDDIEQARALEEKVQKQRDQYVARLNQLQTEQQLYAAKVAELNQQLGEVARQDLTTLQQAHQTLLSELATLESAKIELDKMRAVVERLVKEEEAGSEQLKNCRETLLNCQRELAADNADVKGKEQELPQEYRQPQELNAAISVAEKHRDELHVAIQKADENHRQSREKVSAAQSQVTVAEKNLQLLAVQSQQAMDAWQQRLAQSEFANETAFVAARIPVSQREKLAREVREYEDKCLRAEQSVIDQDALLRDKTLPELDDVKQLEIEAKHKLNAAIETYHQTQARFSQLNDAWTKLKSNQSAQKKLEQEYALVGSLNDVVGGKNAYNLSLHRFVLSVLLDDVLIQAGVRLQKMSKGRYELLRRADVADGRKKSGLDLEVADAYTGKQRPVATLSGGESFMAALSLALGLSDVVQGYSGGIHLDTLFIDEGFGSLDAESLDLAINALIELQATGCMVGVISHVSELKERMDVRLDLMVDQQGSHVHLSH
jgi:exonuclease SbcC